ncbi:hypothetical protein MKW92_031657 [Papaver armeniacum]|nr:hypothetical protein MKW92_031657 [Papaver armeniacum]
MEAATTDVVLSATRKRRRTSKAWNEFKEVFEKGKVTYGECKHCKKNISADSKNGTSSLRKHLKSCVAYKGTQPQINQMFLKAKYIGFRRVLTSLQPNIKLVKRNATKSDCIKIYQMEKKHLYEIFGKVRSRISLTTDMWTCTTQNRGYMALTTHYVDEEWKIQKRILSFNSVDGQHTLELTLRKVLMERSCTSGI